jgi:hypothetical protein
MHRLKISTNPGEPTTRVMVPQFPVWKDYFFWSMALTGEVGIIGFFLVSVFFLRFSLFFGLLSPMSSFSLFLVDDLNLFIDGVVMHLLAVQLLPLSTNLE